MQDIYTKQDERAARDDDSNFSAESFKRKRRTSIKKLRRTGGYSRDITKPGVDLKLTPLETYEDEDVS